MATSLDQTKPLSVPFGGVEVLYMDGDGIPQQRVLSPPDAILELHLPTVDEISPLREEFADYVRGVMTKENDPEYRDAYDNYKEVKDFYQNTILDKLFDLFLSKYSEEEKTQIDMRLQQSQVARITVLVSRYFGVDSILKSLQETQGTLPGNS